MSTELDAMEWWMREPTPYFPDAPCQEIGVDGMVSDRQRPTNAERDAIRLTCGRCPFQQACLDYALRVRVPYGWWGGTTPREREHILAASQC